MDWGMKIVDVVLSVNPCVDCLDAWGACLKKGRVGSLACGHIPRIY
jgi:hypothetical protein